MHLSNPLAKTNSLLIYASTGHWTAADSLFKYISPKESCNRLHLITSVIETKRDKQEVNNMTQKTLSRGNAPHKKFKAGAVTATVWVNEGKGSEGQHTQYRTISLERNYMDKSGNWQTTSSFRLNDLPKAQVVLQKAYESMVLGEQSLKGGNL